MNEIGALFGGLPDTACTRTSQGSYLTHHEYSITTNNYSYCYIYSVTSPSSVTFFTNIMRLKALSRLQSCTYTLHWTYMKTSPPVKPIATTTSLVQNGQSRCPSRISCAVRSIKTQSDHTTHVMAITWNETEHKIFLLSLWVIFRDCHYFIKIQIQCQDIFMASD